MSGTYEAMIACGDLQASLLGCGRTTVLAVGMRIPRRLNLRGHV